MRMEASTGTRASTETMVQVRRARAVLLSLAQANVQEVGLRAITEANMELSMQKLRVGHLPRSRQRRQSEKMDRKLTQRR